MRGEDHAGSADAALGSAFFEKALLDGMEFLVFRKCWAEAFDGGDLRAFGLQDGDEAGVDQVAVDQDGAGSALVFAAALFGSGEVQSSRGRRGAVSSGVRYGFSWPLMVNWMWSCDGLAEDRASATAGSDLGACSGLLASCARRCLPARGGFR
jgi:hypothetical protein